MVCMNIMCPICNEVVRGEGENDLSLNLQNHFMTRHGYTELCDLKGGDEETACQRSGSGDLADLQYDERILRESHGSEESIHPGEDVMQSVRCPLCGKTVFGHVCDDLSYNLAKHMNFNHRVKTSIIRKR